MAKVKVKLDVDAIKKWLLNHGEKLALGFAGLMFLMFTWSAISREVLDASKQPAQLQQKAADVGAHVTRSPWEEKTAGIQVISYDERAKRERVAPEAFKVAVPFNQPLADPKTKRANPEMFPVEELKVASGFGTFSLQGGKAGAGQAGTSKLTGLPWVAITGLVPFQKQGREYSQVFERALGRNRDRDVPRYAGFKLERAEINDQDPGKLEWKPVAAAPFEKEFDKGPAEVVNTDFVDSELTVPLKPLVPPNWGDAVTHPKIPLAVQTNAKVPPPPQAAPVDVPKDVEPQDAAAPFRRAKVRKDPNQPPSAPTNAAQPDDAELAYHLFRAFDFTVEPNKKYRYRVAVGLENPNFEVPLRYLTDPETAKKEFIETKPTEPSGVISVPDGYQVLAGVVKPPKLGGEPSATLMLIAIDKEVGGEATYEHEVGRGTVANTTVKELKVRPPINPNQVEERQDVKFKSDMVVLDMRGGKKVSGKSATNLTSPGEVLLLDRNGDLMVHSELDDQSMYANRLPPGESESKSKSDPVIDPPKTPAKPKKVKPKR